MTLHLSDRFTFVHDPFRDRGYVTARADGTTSVVNGDAMEVLAGELGEHHAQHESFVNQCLDVGWVTRANTPSGSVRTVSTAHHLKRIQFEINLACNLRCDHCYCSAGPGAARGMSTAAVTRLLDEASDIGVIFFDITGGEPLLRPDLLDLLAHASKRGMIPTLFTNGTIMSPELAGSLRDVGVVSVKTSLDALTPTIHDAIRGRDGAHARTVNGIRLMTEAGLNVWVSVTVQKRNQHEIAQLRSFVVEELGADCGIDRVIPAGRATSPEDDVALSSQEYYQLLRELYADTRGMLARVCKTFGGSNEAIEPSCGVGASYAFIRQDGEVVLCPTMTTEQSPDFGGGRVGDTPLATLWEHHPTFARYRGVQCRNVSRCPTGSECQGGCRSNAYILHGEVDSPDEMMCNFNKNEGPLYAPMEIVNAPQPGQRARRLLPVLS